MSRSPHPSPHPEQPEYPAPHPSTSARGFRVNDRYVIKRKLGSGSTGTVFLAADLSREHLVALKVINPERLDSSGLLRLQEEFRQIADLKHPNIAQAFDFGYTDEEKLPFYTREFISGQALLPGPPTLSDQTQPRRFLRPFIQLLDALHYLHTQGILHLDIHAGNVIVSDDPKRGAVLIDFGLYFGANNLPSTASFLSRSVWPPELIRGEAPGPGTDIYSIGRLLLFRLTGSYDGSAVLPHEIPGWGSRRTLELERIVSKALQADSDLRFSTINEVSKALSSILGEDQTQSQSIEPSEVTFGRNQQLETIDEQILKIQRGESIGKWISGPLGIGKSRLLTESRWRAQLRGLSVLETSFLPNAILGDTLQKRLQDSLELEGQEQPSTWLSPLSIEHGGSTEERSRRAAQGYFDQPGDPLILLIDDFQNADRESQLLIKALWNEIQRRKKSQLRGRGLGLFITSTNPPSLDKNENEDQLHLSLLKLNQADSKELLLRLLQPLEIEESLLELWLKECGGLPLRIRQASLFIHREIRRDNPRPIPKHRTQWAEKGTETDINTFFGQFPDGERTILEILAIMKRPTAELELIELSTLEPKQVTQFLKEVTEGELLRKSNLDSKNYYFLDDDTLRSQILESLSKNRIQELHQRAAKRLSSKSEITLVEKEALARHLIASDSISNEPNLVIDVAQEFKLTGNPGRALSLLEFTLQAETQPSKRLDLAEKMSELHEEAGDHPDGIKILEPELKAFGNHLSETRKLRYQRRLGVHYHRSGHPDKALSIFEQFIQEARTERDLEELIFVHSEVAEIHTFRGQYTLAEQSCRTGLDLIDQSPTITDQFKSEMQVTLNATLGHLELRRLHLDQACYYFEAALKLAQLERKVGLRALILNNLGIAKNQLNRFEEAEKAFHQAEELLKASGERNARIHIACNLGLIRAKLGDPKKTKLHLDRALSLIKDHPGERLEFFYSISKAVTQHHLGYMSEAIKSFEKAIPVGKKFGDSYLVHFSEIYLAEAYFYCGRFQDAVKTLKRLLQKKREEKPPVIFRMAACRLLFLGAWLKNSSWIQQAEETINSIPKTDIELLETWNDLFLGLSFLPNHQVEFTSIRNQFETWNIPAGMRLARLGTLIQCLHEKDHGKVRQIVFEIESDDISQHRIVPILEYVFCAESNLFLGNLDRCDQNLQRASTAMVGLPFLELDWYIEFNRARLAEKKSNRPQARHHLYRSLQAREFICRTLPATWQSDYLSHLRFEELEFLRQRIERSHDNRSTPLAVGTKSYFGILGRSQKMKELFESIERIKNNDLCVLIEGPTGSGKDLVAKAIHQSSHRKNGPYYSLHCGSLPTELFESELFGYEAGAFTGAEENRIGLLEHLKGGTLLLDSITHLPLSTQSKLLQVIDSQQVRPLGGLNVRPIDVRILASTNQSAEKSISEGRLREDLAFRLRQFDIRVPALSERLEDLPLLAKHFIEHHAHHMERPAPSLSPDALFHLGERSWPGNVRELETLMIKLVVTVSPGSLIDSKNPFLKPSPVGIPKENSHLKSWMGDRNLKELRTELERAYLEKAFIDCQGDIKTLTQFLGIKRSNLYTWLKKVGLDVKDLREKLD